MAQTQPQVFMDRWSIAADSLSQGLKDWGDMYEKKAKDKMVADNIKASELAEKERLDAEAAKAKADADSIYNEEVANIMGAGLDAITDEDIDAAEIESTTDRPSLFAGYKSVFQDGKFKGVTEDKPLIPAWYGTGALIEYAVKSKLPSAGVQRISNTPWNKNLLAKGAGSTLGAVLGGYAAAKHAYDNISQGRNVSDTSAMAVRDAAKLALNYASPGLGLAAEGVDVAANMAKDYIDAKGADFGSQIQGQRMQQFANLLDATGVRTSAKDIEDVGKVAGSLIERNGAGVAIAGATLSRLGDWFGGHSPYEGADTEVLERFKDANGKISSKAIHDYIDQNKNILRKTLASGGNLSNAYRTFDDLLDVEQAAQKLLNARGGEDVGSFYMDIVKDYTKANNTPVKDIAEDLDTPLNKIIQKKGGKTIMDIEATDEEYKKVEEIPNSTTNKFQFDTTEKASMVGLFPTIFKGEVGKLQYSDFNYSQMYDMGYFGGVSKGDKSSTIAKFGKLEDQSLANVMTLQGIDPNKVKNFFKTGKYDEDADLFRQFPNGKFMPRMYLAVGGYQFIPGTLAVAARYLARESGVPSSEILKMKFTPELQDKLALMLIKYKQPKVWKYINSQNPTISELEGAVEGMASEWASFQGVNGKGKYDKKDENGKWLNKATITPEQTVTALNKTRALINKGAKLLTLA